jgi:hypothetical protein
MAITVAEQSTRLHPRGGLWFVCPHDSVPEPNVAAFDDWILAEAQ